MKNAGIEKTGGLRKGTGTEKADIPNRIDTYLGMFMWCMIGLFACSAAFRVYDFYKRPEFYALQEQAWYEDILSEALVTAVVVLVILWVRGALRRGQRKDG